MSSAGYSGTHEHLRDELARVDQLIRAQAVRWRHTLAESKPEHLWGMVHVTEREVDAFLEAPFLAFDELPAELENVLRPYWDQATSAADAIARRLEDTESRISRLSRLVERFALSSVERDILLVALLPTVDERYRRLFGYLQDDCSRSTTSVGLISQVLHPTARAARVRSALAAEAPLRALRLVDVERGETRPLAMRSVVVDDRIAAFLCEEDWIDEHLVGIVECATGRSVLKPSWPSLEPLLAWLSRRHPGELPPVCFLEGSRGDRLAVASSLCAAAGATMLIADVRAAMRSRVEWTEIVERVYREAALRNAWITWRDADALEGDIDQRVLLEAARDATEGTLLISTRQLRAAAIVDGRPVVRLEVPSPCALERQRIWEMNLGGTPVSVTHDDDIEGLAAHLASLYRLSHVQIRAAVVAAAAAARARDPERPIVTADDLAAGCRAQTAVQASGIAERVEPRSGLTLDTLIVPPPVMSQINELRHRIEARHSVTSALGLGAARSSRGVTAMFVGASGCGKTLAAEALASELRVDLYRVDLSAVVSKYVGETEKNLARVFSEIQDSDGILFFDEADALFGKRGEVVDARDRWANTEVNYLLQTLERYEGVVILATNLRQNIDSAFTRRIQIVIEFPFPDAAARQALLHASLGALARPPDTQLEAVAERFQLTGGSIANVAIDSVFRALVHGTSGPTEVTLSNLAAAIAGEYRRLGKPITRGEFGSELYELATVAEPIAMRG
jgi:hypothetical protein